MKKSLIIFIVIVLSACSVKLLVPAQSDVDRVASKYPGYTLAQLSEGKNLYENKCAACHGLKNPASRSEAQWNHEVPDMAEKAQKKAGKEVITKQEQESILKYLVTMSTAPKKK